MIEGGVSGGEESNGAGLGEEVGEVELAQSVDSGFTLGTAGSKDPPATHRRGFEMLLDSNNKQ